MPEKPVDVAALAAESVQLSAADAVDKATDQALIEELQRRGHRVTLEPNTQGEGRHLIPVKWSDAQTVKLAFLSDTHLGSKFQQLTHLHSFYRTAEEAGVQAFLHSGDIVDGSHKAHKDIIYHQFIHGYTPQIDYAVEHLPRSEVPTYAINGNHDDWYQMDAGANVASAIAKERDDIVYIGDRGAHVWIDKLRMYLWHPRGGAGYARSYALQNWVRDCDPDERPDFLLAGHWHVRSYLPRYSGIHCFQVPCFQATTPFIRTIAKTAEVGGWIVEVGMDDDGKVGRVATEAFTYEPIHADY